MAAGPGVLNQTLGSQAQDGVIGWGGLIIIIIIIFHLYSAHIQ